MPCLFVLLAFAVPRLVAVLLWLFTTWFSGVFPNLLWPVLGFIFMPTTMLWYTAVVNWFGGQWTLWPVAGMVIAVMLDLSQSQGARRRAA